MKYQKNIFLRHIIFRYLPLLLWFSLIWILSSQEGLSGNANPTLWFYLERKGAHVVEYFILTFLIWRVVGIWTKSLLEQILWTCIWVLWGAVFDESHQTLVMGREGKISDVGIDMIGASFALFFLIRSALKKQK